MLGKSFFSTKSISNTSASFGILLLRAGFGLLMLTHGIPKLSNFSVISKSFNPIGLGGTLSLSLVIFAEVFCAIAVILGLFTRLATIPLITSMLVAILVVHAGQPLESKEMALLYLLAFTVVLFTGPGRFSVDRFIWK